MTHVWTRTLTAGYGRAINRPTRIARIVELVSIVGPVAFEPSLVRVRRASGEVVRARRDELATKS